LPIGFESADIVFEATIIPYSHRSVQLIGNQQLEMGATGLGVRHSLQNRER